MDKSGKRGERIFTMVFLVLLLIYSAGNMVGSASELSGWLEEELEEKPAWPEWKEMAQELEEEMNEELLFRHSLLELYGSMQLVQGKHEENGFETVKGKDGSLYSGSFWNGFGDDQKELAVRTRKFFDELEKSGVQTGFIMCPMNIPDEKNRYAGIPYGDYTELSSELCAWLRYYGVDVLDLRNIAEESGLEREEAFFRTDHHWTPQAAFLGYCRITEWMEQEFGTRLENADELRDLQQYEQVTYQDLMLGSMGRKCGLAYAGGMEDYTVIYPKDPGSYILRRGTLEKQKEYEGAFTEALLDMDYDEDDIYDGEAERTYLHNGVDTYASIVNQEAPSQEKVLILRDSYATPVGAFLAQSFARVDMLWSLGITEEELNAYLEENTYDYIFIMLYPENLSERSFPF